MSRSRESGAYLGGIGTMLGETRACTACGGIHESAPYGLQHRGTGACPAVVAEDFAVVSLVNGEVRVERNPSSEPSVPLRTPLPLSVGGLPLPPREAPRTGDGRFARNLEVPWLPPPDLTEVF